MPKTRDSFPPTSATANLSVTPKSQTKPRVTNITMSKRPIRDRFFVGNYYCCDGCREAPLDPDPMQRNTSLVKLIRKDFYFYLTIVLIISVNVLFILLVAPYLVEHIGIIVLVISQVLFVQIILFLLATACTDPGILPRALDAEALAVQQEIIKDNKSQEKLDQKSQPPTKIIWINGQMIQFKYCYTCRFFRPPRSIHCSVCNRCIDRFDHHCPWISNCVGRRNYRSFFMFLLTLSSYMIFTSACELAFLILVAQKHGLHRTFRQHPVIFVMLAMALVSLWSIVGLTGFHVFLSCTNLTTNEDIKQAYVAEVFDNNNELILNPFTEGSPYLNCQRTLCESRPRTFLKKINK